MELPPTTPPALLKLPSKSDSAQPPGAATGSERHAVTGQRRARTGHADHAAARARATAPAQRVHQRVRQQQRQEGDAQQHNGSSKPRGTALQVRHCPDRCTTRSGPGRQALAGDAHIAIRPCQTAHSQECRPGI